MFEHTVTYLGIRLEGATRGDSFPIPDSLWTAPEYAQYFERMGEQGWELVSVTPLIFGQFTQTAGYYFFWKRDT